MKTYFLPVGLVLALLMALVNPEPGNWLADKEWTSYFVAAIFFMNGYDFVLKDFKLNRHLAFHILLICGLSLLGAPCFAFALGLVFQFEFSWLIGLYTIACVPTTLSSGIVIAAQAGGNRSVAVVLTILMNFLGVFILPYSLAFLLRAESRIEFDSLQVLLELCFKVLLPFAFGYLIKHFSKEEAKFGNMLPSSIVILIVFYSSSQSQSLLLSSSFLDLFKAASASLLLHVILFCLILLYSKVFRIIPALRKTLLFCGSQKTLPLSIVVLTSLEIETGQALVLCICFHFTQLILDSFLAAYLKQN